jgi:glycosyltransferase involved in cell wall biosynthesis
MKIALYFVNEGKEAGGTFALAEEVINYIKNTKYEKFEFLLLVETPNKVDYPILKKNNFKKIIKIKRGRFRSYFENIYQNVNIINQNFNYFSTIDKICLNEKVDFVWFLDMTFDRLTDFPYAMTVLDLEHLKQSYFSEWGSKKNWYNRNNNLENFLKKSLFIMTGTKIGKKEIKDFYGVADEKIYINPHPTPEKYKDADNKKNNVTNIINKKNFFFYPSNFWAHKNHKNAIIAMKIFLEKNDANLFFVGSKNKNQKKLENFIKKMNLEKSIHFLGFVSNDDMLQLYKRAEFLLYPSWGGPENLPPLEAFSLGCPVIANSIPGAIEQLGDNALLIDCSDPNIIAYHMNKLFNDIKLREELIKKGCARAEQWKIDNYVKKYLDIFDKYLKKYNFNFYDE